MALAGPTPLLVCGGPLELAVQGRGLGDAQALDGTQAHLGAHAGGLELGLGGAGGRGARRR